MRYFSTLRARFAPHYCIYIGFFLSALITWPILARLEAFEWFHDYSRAHEDWDLDEFAMLIINLTLALLFSAIYQARRLKRLWRERDALRTQAEISARYDPLTGVFNRRAFKEVLGEAIQKQATDGDSADGARFLALLDLDRFKPVNELHGHSVGDATLVAVKERLVREIGAAGVVARLGSDEFVMLFDEFSDARKVERATQRLVYDLAQPIQIGEVMVHVGVSAGLVQIQSKYDVTEVLRRADKALFQARSQGRGLYAWYDETQDQQSRNRTQITADLREAIANGDLKPWYQPIVSADENKIRGLEILARWQHPVRGFVPPDVFVELAEDCGLIGAMGQSILRRACLDARDWDENLTLSFNVSGLQFNDPNLIPSIQEILVETGFPAGRLILEVTERSVIDDFEEAGRKIEELKDIGVSIALDDFGTGHSSLACLQRLPFDGLKIDRSFVTDISEQTQNQSIVAGIVTLARGLALEVTAEGIETAEDLAFVRELACEKAQGFLFAKAVPAEQVTALLQSDWAAFGQDAETAQGV
ncbi:putative bifunctional diguanylate cyclase/phosphodiesterase [Shimia sp.]|uniref:putative bifunctional diguanylate cyclase/phosphodiesterase n=1 Tax=Shimia sp. TaxID=1954381 RepID=UPI003BAA0BA1